MQRWDVPQNETTGLLTFTGATNWESVFSCSRTSDAVLENTMFRNAILFRRCSFRMDFGCHEIMHGEQRIFKK